MPILLTNAPCSKDMVYCHERTLKLTPINLPASYKNAIAATFFDLDDDTHLDILMINKQKEEASRRERYMSRQIQRQNQNQYQNPSMYDQDYDDTYKSIDDNNSRQPRNTALGGWNNGYTYAAEALTLSDIHDAFFAKIFVLNGRCISWCDSSEGDGFSSPEPIGAIAVGSTVSTLFKDVHGNDHAEPHGVMTG